MFRRLMMTAAAAAAVLAAGAPTAGATADAHARAREIIVQQQVSDLFDDASGEDDIPRIRHRRSGAVCSFPKLSLLQAIPGVPRGEGIVCGSNTEGVAVVLSVFRMPETAPLAEAMDAFAGGVAQSWPEMRPTSDASIVEMSVGGLPRYVRRTYSSRLNGRMYRIYATLAFHGEWGVAQVAIGEAGRDEIIDRVGEAEFALARRGVGKSAL